MCLLFVTDVSSYAHYIFNSFDRDNKGTITFEVSVGRDNKGTITFEVSVGF